VRTAAALALDGIANEDGPVLVHLDVDVVDPLEMPAKGVLTDGTALSLAEVSDLVTAFLASPRVIGIEVVEYDPTADTDGLYARKIVDLLVRALARRLRD
jgi:arginase family enzyme